jgi:hypothetical protein
MKQHDVTAAVDDIDAEHGSADPLVETETPPPARHPHPRHKHTKGEERPAHHPAEPARLLHLCLQVVRAGLGLREGGHLRSLHEDAQGEDTQGEGDFFMTCGRGRLRPSSHVAQEPPGEGAQVRKEGGGDVLWTQARRRRRASGAAADARPSAALPGVGTTFSVADNVMFDPGLVSGPRTEMLST